MSCAWARALPMHSSATAAIIGPVLTGRCLCCGAGDRLVMVGERVTEGDFGGGGFGLDLSHGFGGSTLVSLRGFGLGGSGFGSTFGSGKGIGMGCGIGSVLSSGTGSSLGSSCGEGAFGIGMSFSSGSGSFFTGRGSRKGLEKPRVRSRGSILWKSIIGIGGGGGIF